jgi:hypothetical protein
MSPFYYNNSLLLILLIVWSIPWKIYAVWTAVKRNQKGWFVALAILNTFSILEIIYIFYVAKKKPEEIRKDFSRALLSRKKE